MMESSQAPLPELQKHPLQNSNEVSIQELLATIGELHVANRRLLMRVEQLEFQLMSTNKQP